VLAALKVAVAVMSVLIVVGVVVLAVTVARRLSGPRAVAGPLALDEPAGTALEGVALAGDRMAVRLRGGGPDRVVVIDLRDGRVAARVGLAR
jgi:hypothetical protein